MSESFAVALYSFIGLVCAVGLLHVLVRRLLPETPSWLLVIASAGIALTNVAPFILRRPAQYEVAISAGYCFVMAGILLIVTAVLASPPRRRQLAFGSLCLGLALGGRPTLAPAGVVAVGAAVYLIRRRGVNRSVLIPALAPFLICGLLLAAYNDVRFGSVTEFGQRYQMAGIDVTAKPTNQLDYIPPGLYSYLVVPARLSLTFPHAFLMTATEYPGALPPGYAGTAGGGPAEPAGGTLTTMPITLLLLIAPILWWRRRSAERPALLIAAGFAGLGLAIVGLVSWALWGTTQRYEVDFATFFLIAAFLVWATLLARFGSRKLARRGIALAGIALTAFGAAVGTAVSITGYYDALLVAHPGMFRTLENITSPFATAATMVVGRPVLVRVDGPLPVDLPPQGYGAFGERGAGTWLGRGPVTVTVVSPGAQRMALRAVATPGPGGPPHAALAVRVQSPDQGAVSVPVVGGYVRLPIRLHWGLNRIRLGIGGAKATSPEELYLGHIVLSR
jgi:hypothetical protein